MITTTRPQKNYVNIELYFVDLEKRNEYAIYAKGWASGATKKVSERCFYVLMKNLEKYNVAIPLKE
ncbi:MAG: hypothetical protein IPH89_07745 [Bacteroidetes bacterium]|nr:hypothetical protein [Bacteroidota bacterium]